MGTCETLIRHVAVIDGTGAPPFAADVAIADGRVAQIGDLADWHAARVIQGGGKALSPGFVDVHTHDDTNVISSPGMLPKLSRA